MSCKKEIWIWKKGSEDFRQGKNVMPFVFAGISSLIFIKIDHYQLISVEVLKNIPDKD